MKRNDSGTGYKKWFKYKIEFQIARSVVADDSEIDNESAHDMIVHRFPFALNPELKARVIESPTVKAIRKAQR